ncbi:hypothetical protein LJC34_00755 [Oscillospiraceae bacterium OttesenSCG-928-G22]|nr:hypothetical protein [Oscillospiraceae bacterium OttesenSCG-928-G22]
MPIANTQDSRWYGNMADYTGTDMNTKSTIKGNDTLDKNAFLNILIAQLQNQDPLSPMDNSEMVNQLTQFTTIEQLQQQTSAITMNQAYGLIGKYATAQLRNDAGVLMEGYVYGRVDSVFKQNGETWLTVGGVNVKQDDIREVYDVSSITGDAGEIANAAAVIGKYIVAKEPVYGDKDDEDKITEYKDIGGYVKSVVVRDGITYVKFTDAEGVEKEVSFIQITEIHTEEPPAKEPENPGEGSGENTGTNPPEGEGQETP